MSIYRQAPTPPYLCPRCGDVLDDVFDLVRVCMACEGVWLERAVVKAALADVGWPGGRAMWWRNTLECPACKLANRHTQLTATAVGDVMIDRCPEGHGVFLDRGELGRLMRTSSDELLTLLDLLAEVDGAQLAARRASWKRARDERQTLIAKHGAYLAELARQQQQARAEEAASTAATARAARLEAEARRRATLDEAQREAERARWRGERAVIAGAHEQLLKQVATARLQLAALESSVVEQRALEARLEVQVAGMAGRLADIDGELAALG